MKKNISLLSLLCGMSLVASLTSCEILEEILSNNPIEFPSDFGKESSSLEESSPVINSENSTPMVSSPIENSTPIESSPVEPSIPSIEDPTVGDGLNVFENEFDLEKITVWAPETEKAYIEKAVNLFNASGMKTQKLEVEVVTINEFDTENIFMKNVEFEGAPDLFYLSDNNNAIYKLAYRDVLEPISISLIKENAEYSLDAINYNNSYYAYPVSTDANYFMWYDKSQVDNETINSLEKLLAHAKSLGKQVLMDVPNGWYSSSFTMSLDACGKDNLHLSLDGDGNYKYTAAWNSKQGVQISEYISSLLSQYYTDGTLVTGSNDTIISGFSNNTMIAAISGKWMESSLKTVVGDKLGANILPKYNIEGKEYRMSSFASGKYYGVNKNTSYNKKLTAAVLGYYLSCNEMQMERVKELDIVPTSLTVWQSAEYEKYATIGNIWSSRQSAYSVSQAASVASRYWDIGMMIGQAYIDNSIVSSNGKTWEEFLDEKMRSLTEINEEFVSKGNSTYSLYIIGSHWNTWDASTIESAEGCAFTPSKTKNGWLELEVVITPEMLENWVGFKFVASDSWIEQYGMEDIDWSNSNDAFKNLYPDGKEQFINESSNRTNLEIKAAGTYKIEYNPLNLETTYLENGATHTNKLVVTFTPAE